MKETWYLNENGQFVNVEGAPLKSKYPYQLRLTDFIPGVGEMNYVARAKRHGYPDSTTDAKKWRTRINALQGYYGLLLV